MPFDPRESAQRQVFAVVHGQPPASYLRGRWGDRHPLNTPGPFYAAATDTCCDGPPIAPDSLTVDKVGQGIVWRQPRDNAEILRLLAGCWSDPFSGFAWDGDERWTVDLVRHWWRERASHIADITDTWSGEPPTGETDLFHRITAAHLAYLAGDTIVADLRRYLFRLSEGRYSSPHEPLPRI